MDEPRNHPAESPGYEVRDANTRGVFTFLVILGTVLVLVSLACWGLFRYFSAHPLDQPASDSPFAGTRQIPLGPQLQVNPREDWLKFRADQEKSLQSYAWENRSAGIARVPIDVAMDLLVKKGMPVQGAAESQPNQANKPAAEGGKKP